VVIVIDVGKAVGIGLAKGLRDRDVALLRDAELGEGADELLVGDVRIRFNHGRGCLDQAKLALEPAQNIAAGAGEVVDAAGLQRDNLAGGVGKDQERLLLDDGEARENRVRQAVGVRLRIVGHGKVERVIVDARDGRDRARQRRARQHCRGHVGQAHVCFEEAEQASAVAVDVIVEARTRDWFAIGNKNYFF